MKNSKITSCGDPLPSTHHRSCWLTAALVITAGLSSTSCQSTSRERDYGPTASVHAKVIGGGYSNYDDQDAEVLTRGPVHEAFAGMVAYDSGPGLIISRRPPEPIEELAPYERPAGEDVTWIPGYWGWDDDRTDFLWVSGTWRALPPGRAWIAGYWGESRDGYQWTSGYWADAEMQETTYLPQPPRSLESGPNIDRPSIDYGWTPGCWVWYRGHYAWRPGYWAEGRGDWVWVPAYYVWTPHGHIFVEGFWDYTVQRRGMLYAPVYIQSRAYGRRGYSYSPRIVINLGLFTDNLFMRPRYSHYYFGDYYAPRYSDSGFYFSFSWHSDRYGYDPFYSHRHWEHRRDRDWDNRFRASYRYRRDNEIARPPATWAAQVSIYTSTTISVQNRIVIAGTAQQLANREEYPVRVQKVAAADRQKFSGRAQEVQKSREQRRTLETRTVEAAGQEPGKAIEPSKVKLPRSPIVARSAKQFSKDQAPPKVQKEPELDLTAKPGPATQGRRSDGDRNSAATEKPKAGAPDRSAANQDKADARDSKAKQAADEQRGKAAATAKAEKESQAKARKDSEQRASDVAAKAKDDSQRKVKESQQKAQQAADEQRGKAAATAKAEKESQAKAKMDSDKRANAAAAKAQEDSQRKVKESQQKAKQAAATALQQAEKRERDATAKAGAATKAKQDAENRARDAEAKAQAAEKSKEEATQRAQIAATKAQEESQRNAKESAAKARQEAAQLEKEAAAKAQASTKARKEAEARANDAAVKAQAEANAQTNAKAESDKRAKAAEAKALEESKGKAKEAEPAAKGKKAKDDEEAAKKDNGKGKPGA